MVPGVQAPPRDLLRAADPGLLQEEGRWQPGSRQEEVCAVVHGPRLLKASGQIFGESLSEPLTPSVLQFRRLPHLHLSLHCT